MESFGRDTPEFKENFAKIPQELLDLFDRQFQSKAIALRVGKIETKEDLKKSKKRHTELEDESMFIGDDEEESY